MNRKEKAVIISIAANLILIALKFVLAYLSGSIALTASAWHSFSDLIPSLIVLVGLILARREDTETTRGVSRIENIIALIVAGFIFYVGIEIVRDVLSGSEEELTNVPLVAVISLASIGLTYFMARYQVYVGRETGSPSLIASGAHARVDMYSSIVVVAALAGAIMGFRALDRIAAAVIVLLILGNGIEVLSGAVSALRRGGFLVLGHHVEEIFLEKIARRARLFALAGLILAPVAYAASGLFTVQWNEAAIVKRFGKPVRQVEPGLHYRIPWPVETVDLVRVGDVRVEQIPSSLTLTGDENLIDVEAVAHYRIKSASDFLYNLSDPGALVRDVVESALRGQVNRYPIDFILAEGMNEIQRKAGEMAQEVLDRQQSGILLLAVQLTRDAPPAEVMEGFRDVASAREDRNTYVNEALAYQAEVVPKARGEAQKQVEEALAYKEQKVRSARGDAGRFLSRLDEYGKNRDITEKRLYIEAMEKSLAGAKKLIVDDKVQVNETGLWFMKGKSGKEIAEEVE